MERKKMIAIAHKKDLDGIASHAILRRYAKQKIKHIFADYDELHQNFKEAAKAKGEEIVIADLGYGKMVEESLPLLKELCKANTVRWFDHHDWSNAKDILKLPIKFVINPDFCAAELVQKEYLSKDAVASQLAGLAHDQDYMGENELARKLYDVISAGYDVLKLVQQLSEGNLWSRELEQCYSEYQKIKSDGFAYLDEHSKLYKIGRFTCLLGFSKDELSSTLAAEHLLNKNQDLVICLWKDGKMSFRRNNKNINLKKLAGFFNGGGRETAAGGFYGRNIEEKKYLKVFDEIVEKIALAYQELDEFIA